MHSNGMVSNIVFQTGTGSFHFNSTRSLAMVSQLRETELDTKLEAVKMLRGQTSLEQRTPNVGILNQSEQAPKQERLTVGAENCAHSLPPRRKDLRAHAGRRPLQTCRANGLDANIGASVGKLPNQPCRNHLQGKMDLRRTALLNLSLWKKQNGKWN